MKLRASNPACRRRRIAPCCLLLLRCPARLTHFVMQTECRKLRWYAPIWKDPLRWARWVGNSRVNLVCAVVVQLAFCGIWIGSLFSFATVRSVDELGWLSHIPLVFWYLSIIGGIITTAYAIHKRDIVFIIGQGAGLIVYVRNLMLIYRAERTTTPPAPETRPNVD